MAQFGIKFGLPAPGAVDVATRELSITTNGAEPPVVQTLAGMVNISEEVTFNDGDSFSVVLVDIDGHGNRSQPSAAFTGTVVDDVAPPIPGEVTLAEKRQID